jgi:hypothetical protein
MLHLAQVKVEESTSQVKLRLLARQTSEHSWAILGQLEGLLPVDVTTITDLSGAESLLKDSCLVLVQLSEEGQVLSLGESTQWILGLLQTYLTSDFSPDFLKQEAERAEQWRQTLTLQNQELGRQRLEIEARREQIQAMEEDLKQERERLELIAAELQQSRDISASSF